MEVKDKNKRIEEKEKIDAEIERSLSVVKMKEVHKQIEEIVKSRKKDVILSVIKRIDIASAVNSSVLDELAKVKKEFPERLWSMKLSDKESSDAFNHLVNIFESIRFDFKQNVKIGDEDFKKIFPMPILRYASMEDHVFSISCMSVQMIDMKAYCMRLI